MKKSLIAILTFAVLMTAQPVLASAATAPLRSVVDDLQGTPYKWAGTSEKGFDCSGFTQYVFAKFGVDLPHSSAGQAEIGEKVAREDLRPGDLVFFHTYASGISHVGIYVGNNNFAHAADNGVIMTDLDEAYYAKRYVTARRVLSDEEYAKFALGQKDDAAQAAPLQGSN